MNRKHPAIIVANPTSPSDDLSIVKWVPVDMKYATQISNIPFNKITIRENTFSQIMITHITLPIRQSVPAHHLLSKMYFLP